MTVEACAQIDKEEIDPILGHERDLIMPSGHLGNYTSLTEVTTKLAAKGA
ncbi:hypothetical protein [Marinovum sp.]|nr:hypothetical protein [Marinovum sp.]